MKLQLNLAQMSQDYTFSDYRNKLFQYHAVDEIFIF
jgi:hypothetical protein